MKCLEHAPSSTSLDSLTNSPTPSTADREPPTVMAQFGVCKQVLQVAKWEGSVALVHTHYDPAMGAGKTQ